MSLLKINIHSIKVKGTIFWYQHQAVW